MVKGLDLFREHFAEVIDQYVLIGGTAATLAMDEVGLDFRATKDLDIVLHIEALTPAFGSVFWSFVERGGRKAAGEKVDTGDVRKHANDVMRLSQLLSPESRITLATQIAQDMNRFVTELANDGTYDPEKNQIKTSLAEILDRIRRAYGLG